MWFQIKAYFRFLFRSTNQHGIHSPFVYQLVTLCFYDKKEQSSFKKIKKYRNHLPENPTKKKPLSLRRAKLLARATSYLSIGNALEIGFSEGMESIAIAAQDTNLKLILDEHLISGTMENYFKTHFSETISITNTNVEEFLESLNPLTSFDLLFFHENPIRAVSSFEKLLPFVHNDSVCIFEGIHRSPEMEKNWETIKSHQRTRVSIDGFYWGFVFFRREQVKEDFIVRGLK